jgi:hypothetical protein
VPAGRRDVGAVVAVAARRREEGAGYPRGLRWRGRQAGSKRTRWKVVQIEKRSLSRLTPLIERLRAEYAVLKAAMTSTSGCSARCRSWPLAAAMTEATRGSFRGHSSRASRKMARQSLTHTLCGRQLSHCNGFLDHLICYSEEMGRRREADRLRSLKVEHELERGARSPVGRRAFSP